jgi:hypothetical protein
MKPIFLKNIGSFLKKVGRSLQKNVGLKNVGTFL